MALRPVLYQDYTDEKLLPLIAAGTAAAFDELYRRYGKKMFSYFFRMLWKNRELAEDFVQELFMKVIKHAGSFDANHFFATWLYSMAHNMCKNEYRKEEVRMKFARTKKVTAMQTEQQNPDLQRFKAAIARCIGNLNEEKRSLFILRFQEHLSVPEISTILQLPEGTIKSRLFYLLKEMKEELSEFKTLYIYP